MAKRIQIFGNLFNGFVKKVNGVGPDESGNVEIKIPAPVTDEHINSLIDEKLGVIENGSY